MALKGWLKDAFHRHLDDTGVELRLAAHDEVAQRRVIQFVSDGRVTPEERAVMDADAAERTRLIAVSLNNNRRINALYDAEQLDLAPADAQRRLRWLPEDEDREDLVA